MSVNVLDFCCFLLCMQMVIWARFIEIGSSVHDVEIPVVMCMVGFEGCRSFPDHFALWSGKTPAFIDSAGDAMLHDPGISQVFETKFCHLYPEILLIRKVKLNEKWKEISCFEKPAAAFLIAVLTHFFGRTFDPRRETPGLGWRDRGKVWFGFPFPEDFSTTTHREYRSDPRIRLYRLNKSLRRYALITKVCVLCLD